MPVDADAAAAAVTAALTHMDQIMERGWVQSGRGAFAWITEVTLPSLNGVLVRSPEGVSSGVAASMLEQVAGTGLPFCVQARPAAIPATDELARAWNLIATSPIPLMVMEDPDRLPGAIEVDGFTIRIAGRADTDLYAAVGAAGFEAPEGIFRQLVIEAGFDLQGARSYLGYRDGRPIATGMGLTLEDFVAVFNISTTPGERGRGVGAAVTARAVLDGMAAGATWAWLQSTPAGHRVYERLGFRDMEQWACWISDA
jgi:hypothetical protein